MTGVDTYCRFLETLAPETLDGLYAHVAPDVRFKDPFNDTKGAAAMHAILEDMFEHVGDIRFHIRERLGDGPVAVITWEMSGTVLGKPWRVEGASRLVFDAEGKLAEHVDYWDAASGLYEHFPVIGRVLKALRKKLSVPAPAA